MFILVSVGVIMGVLLRTVHRLVSSIGGEPAASPKPLLSSSSSLSSLSFHMFPSRSCLSGIHQNLWAQRATPTVPTQFWIDFLFISLLPFWGDWGSRGGKHVDTGWSQKLLFFFLDYVNLHQLHWESQTRGTASLCHLRPSTCLPVGGP